MDGRLEALLGKEGARRALTAETRTEDVAQGDDSDPAELGEVLSKKNARALAKVCGEGERTGRRSFSDLLADCSESTQAQVGSAKQS